MLYYITYIGGITLQNILVIGAHFDDSELGCGGTMAKLASEGKNVYKLTLTDNVTNFEQMNIHVDMESSRLDSAKACKEMRAKEITDFDMIKCNALVYTTEIIQKVAMCAVEVVAEYASKWTNGIFDIVKQDDSKATYYKRRTPADGEIKIFSQEANILHNFIRAQTHPYPGTYISTKKGKLYILSSSVLENVKTEENPGTIFAKTENGGILVAAGNNSVIEILRVKKENRPSMWAFQIIPDDNLPINIFDVFV